MEKKPPAWEEDTGDFLKEIRNFPLLTPEE